MSSNPLLILVSVLVPLHMPIGKGYNYTALIAPALFELTKQRVTSEMEFLLLSPRALAGEVSSVRAAVDDSARFRHVHTPHDVGWFGMLNAGWKAAQGTFITVVRIEDRLAHPTINLRRRFLSARASCDVLSSAVFPTTSAGISFGTARKGSTMPGVPDHVLIRPSELFAWGEPRRRGFVRDRSLATGPNEAFRASLMWRSSLASEIGLFNASLNAIADWEFLLRAGVLGKVVCWLRIGLQSYTIPSPLLDDTELEHKEQSAASDRTTSAVMSLYSKFISLRVLVINEVPLSGVEGSHVRMDQVVREIIDAGHQLVYVARDTAWSHDMGKWVDQVRSLGVHVIVGDNNLNSLNNLGNFDIVIMAAWYWRCGTTSVPDLATAKLGVAHSSRMIVLSDDIHWVRATQQELGDSTCDIYTGAIKERELRDYSRADMVIAVTAEDAVKIQPYLHNERQAATCVRFVPVVAKIPPLPRQVHDTYSRRSTFLYVGSHHFGNRRAVHWLLNEVFPLLRASQPDAQLVLVGAEIWREFAANHTDVVPYGVVSDLSIYLKRARVLLVPNLVGGSGISTKTMLALEHLIPFVTTTHGVTAVFAERTPAAFHVKDTARDFAQAALHVYSSLDVWKGTVSAIHSHVSNYLTTARIASALQQTLYTAVSEQCLSPRWSAKSLSTRKEHRIIRHQRQQEARVTIHRPG